jgi:hypothetical protein
VVTPLSVRLNGPMTTDLPEDESSYEKLRRLVTDGIASGERSEVDQDYFDQLRARGGNSSI